MWSTDLKSYGNSLHPYIRIIKASRQNAFQKLFAFTSIRKITSHVFLSLYSFDLSKQDVIKLYHESYFPVRMQKYFSLPISSLNDHLAITRSISSDATDARRRKKSLFQSCHIMFSYIHIYRKSNYTKLSHEYYSPAKRFFLKIDKTRQLEPDELDLNLFYCSTQHFNVISDE